MTKIVLQQALDALRLAQRTSYSEANCVKFHSAIAGLERAIEQRASNIQFLYEQLRQATDGGRESMTHDDALAQIKVWSDLAATQLPVQPSLDIKEFTDRVFRLADDVKYALEQNKLDDAISARLDLEYFLHKHIAQPEQMALTDIDTPQGKI